MKTNWILWAVTLCLAAGCATRPPLVSTTYDAFTGQRTDVMGDNLLPSPADPREMVWLNGFRDFQNYRESSLYLQVTYVARAEAGYLDIRPGQSLTVTADGQTLRFEGSGSLNLRETYRRSKEDFVRESALYAATQADIEKIAQANQVKVQIKGANGLVEREFGPENAERFRAFAGLGSL